MSEDEQYYLMADAARYKGVGYHTVSRAVRTNKLFHTRVGHNVVISKTDLDAWQAMPQKRPKRAKQYAPDATASAMDAIPTHIPSSRAYTGDPGNPGEVIRQRREAAGISQKELGRRIGVSESMVSRIESGKRNLSIWHTRKIAEMFGWDLVKQVVEGQDA